MTSAIKTDLQKLPKLRARVLLQLPREKASKRCPEFIDPCGVPCWIIEVSDNSALISNINEKEPLRVQFD